MLNSIRKVDEVDVGRITTTNVAENGGNVMETEKYQKIYFTKGNQKLMCYLLTVNEKLILAYVKNGKIEAYKPLAELERDIVEFNLKRRKSSTVR